VRAADGSALPRTQSSIAVSADGDAQWFLVNASPDLRDQLATLPLPESGGPRSSALAGVLLTDAEIDHTAGLLLLRESNVPLEVYSSSAVREALTDGFPVLRILESYSGVAWTELRPGAPLELTGSTGSTIEVEAFDVGGDAPLYLGPDADDVGAIGLTFTDRRSGKVLTYIPGLGSLDDQITARLEVSDCVLVDGTFWLDDELTRLGVSTRRAAQMGHAPVAPPTGTLSLLSELAARTILVHINNTNPILLAGSSERRIVEEAGVEIAYDGMDIAL
jgi:pyrroloquinoline quinone biosynthesis protein B